MKEKGWMKKMKYRGLEDHMRRMREMKPVVDDSAPRSAMKSNRREMARRRQYEAIEFDNKLMLERLARALHKKTIDNDKPKMKAIGTQQAKIAEMKRVADENNRILRRIQDAKSAYDHLQWEEDAKKREKYISNMSEFSPQNTSYQLPSPIKRVQSASERIQPIFQNSRSGVSSTSSATSNQQKPKTNSKVTT